MRQKLTFLTRTTMISALLVGPGQPIVLRRLSIAAFQIVGFAILSLVTSMKLVTGMLCECILHFDYRDIRLICDTTAYEVMLIIVK